MPCAIDKATITTKEMFCLSLWGQKMNADEPRLQSAFSFTGDSPLGEIWDDGRKSCHIKTVGKIFLSLKQILVCHCTVPW